MERACAARAHTSGYKKIMKILRRSFGSEVSPSAGSALHPAAPLRSSEAAASAGMAAQPAASAQVGRVSDLELVDRYHVIFLF